METTSTSILKGGEFLLREADPESVFCPEDFNEEQIMLRKSVRDFLNREVESRHELFDGPEGRELAPGLLEQMGQLGFLGIGVPEEYGGFEANFVTQLAFGEIAYASWAFGLSIGVQTSLGVAPLLLYGNAEQKAKYLPGIVSAEIKSCYCLTEPGAGSDANSGKTQAVYSDDRSHFILNGQKMWITSSGHADLFFVFAKIEDDKNLSCFIVEKGYGGIRLGAEEKKMGIKGSSTRQVFFENVPVPAENLLGERQQGFKIALNVLNTGRIKMATSVTGTAKRALDYGLNYAIERVQFGRPIAQFGAIQHKIGEMVARIYAMESLAYRTGGHIDRMHDEMVGGGMDPLDAKFRSIAEFATECAMAKVFNTEGEDFVVDESLQMHGGMGYSAETPIETMYRNARIDRIYEGTNEINRMLTVDMLLRRALKGQLDLMSRGMAVMQDFQAGKVVQKPASTSFADQCLTGIANLKRAALLVAMSASQKLMQQLEEEQEVLMHVADMLMQIYAAESAVLRTLKQSGGEDYELRQAISRLVLYRAAETCQDAGQEALLGFAEGAELEALLDAVEQLTRVGHFNTKALRRQVAEAAITRKGYPIG